MPRSANKQLLRVTKLFRFEMAHALHNYDGPCRNIHGHSYVLTVTFGGTIFTQDGHPRNGFVLDFSELKNAVRREVVDHFDHALVLHDKYPKRLISAFETEFDKIFTVPFQPSCENVVLDIRDRLVSLFEGKCTLLAVKLQETESSWAEWNLADNL